MAETSDKSRTTSLQTMLWASILTSLVGFWLGRQVHGALFQLPALVCYVGENNLNTTTNLGNPEEYVVTDGMSSCMYENERLVDKYGLMVHPALLAHESTSLRVAVVTDSIVAVQEILQHRTVSSVLVAGEESALSTSPECKWIRNHNVTVLADHPTVEFYCQGASKLVLPGANPFPNSQFDVIFVDGVSKTGSLVLSNAEALSRWLERMSLEPVRGMLVVQLSGLPSSELISVLSRKGFESVVSFDTTRHFETLSTLIAMNDWDTRTNWFANEAEVAYRIRRSMVDGGASLMNVDSVTMMLHQLPSRLVENAWCSRNRLLCGNARGFDPAITNHPISLFEVKHSSVIEGDFGSRGIFSKEYMAAHTFVSLDQHVHDVIIPAKALSLSYRMAQEFDIEAIELYADGYGWEANQMGQTSMIVDTSILTFVNHGCQNTHNIAHDDALPGSIYNPRRDRRWKNDESIDLTQRVILPGEEILSNYHDFVGANGEDYDTFLAAMCSGTALGEVASYEQDRSSKP